MNNTNIFNGFKELLVVIESINVFPTSLIIIINNNAPTKVGIQNVSILNFPILSFGNLKIHTNIIMIASMAMIIDVTSPDVPLIL